MFCSSATLQWVVDKEGKSSWQAPLQKVHKLTTRTLSQGKVVILKRGKNPEVQHAVSQSEGTRRRWAGEPEPVPPMMLQVGPRLQSPRPLVDHDEKHREEPRSQGTRTSECRPGWIGDVVWSSTATSEDTKRASTKPGRSGPRGFCMADLLRFLQDVQQRSSAASLTQCVCVSWDVSRALPRALEQGTQPPASLSSCLGQLRHVEQIQ